MIKASYFVFCEGLIRDDSGKISIINIFDRVGGATLPVVPPKLTIAFRVVLSPSEAKKKKINFLVSLDDPDGKRIAAIQGDGKIQAHQMNIISDVDLSRRVSFKKEGTYTARLSVNGQEVADNKLEVLKGSRG